MEALLLSHDSLIFIMDALYQDSRYSYENGTSVLVTEKL